MVNPHPHWPPLCTFPFSPTLGHLERRRLPQPQFALPWAVPQTLRLEQVEGMGTWVDIRRHAQRGVHKVACTIREDMFVPSWTEACVRVWRRRGPHEEWAR